MGEVFCLFFERYQFTFYKEGLSLNGCMWRGAKVQSQSPGVCVWVLVVCCHPKACTVQVPVGKREGVYTVRFLSWNNYTAHFLCSKEEQNCWRV